MRPDYLGGDTIKSVDVILHALSFLEEQDEHYDAVVTLSANLANADSRGPDKWH